MRVSLISLGCKVNQAEIENWQRELHKRGAKIVDFGQEADFYIINTCSEHIWLIRNPGKKLDKF